MQIIIENFILKLVFYHVAMPSSAKFQSNLLKFVIVSSPFKVLSSKSVVSSVGGGETPSFSSMIIVALVAMNDGSSVTFF